MTLKSKQYWGDAATKNCVWLFQTKTTSQVNGEPYNEWHTDTVFLTREEANKLGESRPYAWGKKNEGWRICGVPCDGLMAEICGANIKKFADKVDNPSALKEQKNG